MRRAGLGVNGGRSVVATAGGRGIDGGGATDSFVVTAWRARAERSAATARARRVLEWGRDGAAQRGSSAAAAGAASSSGAARQAAAQLPCSAFECRE